MLMGSTGLMQVQRSPTVGFLNRAGRLLERAGLFRVRCGEADLLGAASKRTGLDDFGGDDFREPLRRLLDSLAKDAQLNFMGRLAARQEVLQLLINRLELQRDRKQFPGIASEKIERPLFITGLPRTGTTLLHGMLAQDPRTRAPLTWEVMYPCPAGPAGAEKRIVRAENNLAWLDRIAPDFKAIHLTGAELPQECVAIMSHAFLSDEFDTLFDVRSYQSWFEKAGQRPAYAFHKKFLQHLQFGMPGRRWVLKAPAHMLAIGPLFETYPDALIVQCHREPLDVIASTTSLMLALRGVFSDHTEPERLCRENFQFWGDMLDHFVEARHHYSPERFFDVDYYEIVRDPLDVVRRIYAHFGDELTPEAEARMRKFVAENPKDKHGRHRYTLEQYGIDPAEETGRFDRYRERFNLAAPRALSAT
jgi:hypothetical protein